MTTALPSTLMLGDMSVCRLGFGAMRITGPGVIGPPADPETCRRVLRRAVELGVNFIDTADSYGPDVSELLIAEALFPYPAGLVIATKAGFDRPGPHRWKMNGRPEHLRARCESSLRRLRVDRIDLFQLHRIDPDVPEADQFGVLEALHSEGKIRWVGLSEVGVDAVARARQTLPVVSVQNRYNIQDRQWDAVVDYCTRERLAFIPWYPLVAGGLQHAGVAHIAASRGATPMQVALAWLLARSPMMLPIPGTASLAHLEENMRSASLVLSPDELRALG